jgi:hypothetical protein
MSLLHFLLRGFGPDAGTTPATPTLAVSDNANGTGAVATITGADGDATVTLYSQLVGQSSWTSRGSRTGNGTIGVSLTATGYYWWHAQAVKNGGSAVSNLVYQKISSSSQAVLDAILDACEARVQSLSLTGIGQVRAQMYPDTAGLTLPAVVIYPPGKELMPGGPNSMDDLVYPIMFATVEASNRKALRTNETKRHLLWREIIRKSFNAQPRLVDVPTVWNSEVDPSDIVNPPGWEKLNLHVSGLLVRFDSRESRNI